MAIHMRGGNTSVDLGGIYNGQASRDSVWANPLAGLTTLTIAVSIKPDFLDFGRIMHQMSSGSDDQLLLDLVPNGSFSGGVGLSWSLIKGDGNFQCRRATTTADALVSGQWSRLMLRWRAAADLVTIWNNGVAVPLVYPSTAFGLPTAAIPRLTINGAGRYGPWEMGGDSALDQLCLSGDYAELAFWGTYLDDVDALHYGQGWSPNLLANSARIGYYKLTTRGGTFASNHDVANEGDGMIATHGHVVNEWGSGTTYPTAYATANYTSSPDGVNPASITDATHPSVFYTVPGTQTPEPAYIPHMLEDEDNLPLDGFELHELQSFPGKRSGAVINVPSQMTLQNALNAAQHGDDIIVALGTYTQSELQIGQKTFTDGVTPTLPPTLQRGRLTVSQPITMS